MADKRYVSAGKPVAPRCGSEEAPEFILQRRTGLFSAVSSLIRQVWDELPRKDWFAVDEPGYLSHVLSLPSTLVFEACTPRGKLAAVCVLVEPAADENLAPYANLPRSEWHRVMHVDVAATLPACRGHSLQSRLMAHAERFLRANRDATKYLMATVHPDNLPSRRSMEKLGYTCVANTTLYGGLPRCVYLKRIFA